METRIPPNIPKVQAEEEEEGEEEGSLRKVFTIIFQDKRRNFSMPNKLPRTIAHMRKEEVEQEQCRQ